MTTTKTYLYDGAQKTRLDDLPPEAWVILSGQTTGNEIEKLYSVVSWLYRCIKVISNGVETMPFEIRRRGTAVAVFDGSTYEDDLPPDMQWLIDLPELLSKVAAANLLGGAAYWERRGNVSGTKVVQYDWLLPWTVKPKISDDLEVIRFDRTIKGRVIPLKPEDVVWFWYPDHGVEMGPAVNFPGRAVLQNAGVVRSTDLFLHGYFDRGMIKATFLKYKDQITPEEAKRVKEWWRRVFTGIGNAFTTEVVRGDFDAMTIGEGVKDLRDNALTKDEKKDIAVGMGVPLSKLDSTASTDANRNADDKQLIEDTVLPEVGWIYKTLNKQIFYPAGLQILALPEQLRVMQQDESSRSNAFVNYVNAGLPPEAVIDILGIDVPEKHLRLMKEERERRREMAAQIAGRKPAEDNEQDEQEDEPPQNTRSLDVIELLDKREEIDRFKRWLKNRDSYDVSEYNTPLLTEDEKVTLAIRHIRGAAVPHEAQKTMDDTIRDYTERMAALASDLLAGNATRDEVIQKMREEVEANITAEYRNAAEVPEGQPLTPEEMQGLNEVLLINVDSIPGLVDAIINNGKSLESLRDIAPAIANRLGLWGNAIRQAINLGRIFSRNKSRRMEWRLGATEEHCASCLAQHGKVRTAEEWLKLAGVLIYPQSRALDCKGYNCDCGLYEV